MIRVNGCCCFGLETGTLVLAILGYFGSIFDIFLLLTWRSRLSQSEEQPKALHYITNSTIVFFVVSFIVHGLLLVGVNKKSTAYFYPYLIFTGLQCIGCTIGTIILFFLLCIYGFMTVGVMALIILIFVSGLLWYFWAVVYSYFYDLKVETENFRGIIWN